MIPRGELGDTFATIVVLLIHFQGQPHVRVLLEAIGDALELDAYSPMLH